MAVYLSIPPDQPGYSISLASDSISTELRGGASRYRRDFVGSSNLATVRWTVGNMDRDFITAFIEDLTVSGTIPFEIDLYGASNSGAVLSRYTVNVVPGTFREISTTGLTHVLGATLEVRRSAEGEAFRAAQALVYAVSEGNSQQYMQLLETVVNVTYADQSGLPPL